MQYIRVRFLPLLPVLLACALPAAHAADAYPVKPVRLLVGYAPGGVNDIVARAVAARLSPRLGQQVIVENRAGAGGNIATQMVARAAPDGYTMLLSSVASHAMSPGLNKDLPFEPVNDFAPITQLVGVSSLISAHPSLPAASLKQLVALAKKQPNKINYASPGTGSIAHLAAEFFMKTAGIKLQHVPYKGGAPAAIDAMAGQVEALIGVISSGAPYVQAGKLRGLGVTSGQRAAILPDVPTVAESGYPGFEASGWLGLSFPAKTPAAIVDRVFKETVAVVNLADVKQQLHNAGLDPITSSPEQFRAYMQAELVKWTTLIREAGIRVE
jgi:tripartite-type tricarboxylate transporter receptor subunit TctC